MQILTYWSLSGWYCKAADCAKPLTMQQRVETCQLESEKCNWGANWK